MLLTYKVDWYGNTVVAISGGGQDGGFGSDWGAEGNRALSVVETVEQLCANHGWTITAEAWVP